MFSTGRVLFALLFLLAFILAMVWSYRRDKAVNQLHFKRPYRVLFALLAFVALMVLLVKIRQYL